MTKTSVAMPKRVRRWQSQGRWKGQTKIGLTHVGKFWRLRNINGWNEYFWGPACLTDEQIRKVETDILGKGEPRGRILTAGATAPITCPRCVKMQEAK